MKYAKYKDRNKAYSKVSDVVSWQIEFRANGSLFNLTQPSPYSSSTVFATACTAPANLTIFNTNTFPVSIGDRNVTVNTGILIQPHTTLSLCAIPDQLYICASSYDEYS